LLQAVLKTIPALPDELEKKYITDFSLSEYDAKVLSDDKDTSDFFESVILHTNHYKAAANWILGPVRSYINDNNLTLQAFPLPPKSIAELTEMTETGQINFSTASSRLFSNLVLTPSMDPLTLATELNLLQVHNDEAVTSWVNEVIQKMPEKVTEYRKGKKALIGLFAGEVKKLSKGKADMVVVNKLLSEKLNQP
jgi:aspartyl-tRNA(Asn)/glutamyl-tRNA(Gln) amidotransferase subunit B